MNTMMRVGITGGIAAGKSTLSRHLREQGFTVIDYDELAHSLSQPGSPVLDQVRTVFGDNSIAADGSLNRLWMAQNVFTDAHKREQLNAIMHPAVYALAAQHENREQSEWTAQCETREPNEQGEQSKVLVQREQNKRDEQGEKREKHEQVSLQNNLKKLNNKLSIIFHDIPLLVETREIASSQGLTWDYIITVEAADDVRIARMMNTRHMTAEQARARIASQLERQEREAVADVVIDSEQPLEDMYAQIDGIVSAWLSS